MQSGSVYLVPPLFEQGATEEFKASGRTLSLAVSPRDNSFSVYATPNCDPQSSRSRNQNQPVYLAAPQSPPRSERRVFVTDTLLIFAAVQNFLKKVRAKGVELPQDEHLMTVLNKLGNDYVNFCKECCLHASVVPRTEPLQFEAEHYRKLYTCFSAFVLLYIPEPAFQDVPVGDELMEWLNTHFIEPSTQEGDELSSQERPWEDPAFWPYLTRTAIRGLSKASAFFLDVLAKHPSSYLQSLAQQLSPLLTDHPRLAHFSAERDFAIASRRWHDKVKALRLELDRVPERARDDGFENWWDRLSDIVGVLEGRADVVKKVCTDLGADWKEVCTAWGIFVDTRLRRQDLPEIVGHILDEMPPDPTDKEDMVYVALLQGRPAEALAAAAELDIWLATHFADLMEAAELIDSEPDESDLSPRQRYLLAYAEYLQSDPGLWRITIDYMYSCGAVGWTMADEILVRVPLRLRPPPASGDATAKEEAARIRSGQLAGVLESVSKTCFEYKREEVRRSVCKIAARTFVGEKEYGLAASYYTSAEDWPGLGRVVDLVLEEYIVQGPAKFAQLVAHIAPSLLQLQLHHTSGGSSGGPPGVFVHRLQFAVRFAEFHRRLAAGDAPAAAADVLALFRDALAPVGWWAPVLADALPLLAHARMLFSPADACVLLQRLEEVHMRVGHGAGDDYLGVLARVVSAGAGAGGEKLALARLQAVRLALARYYARCGAIDVGGRTSGWSY